MEGLDDQVREERLTGEHVGVDAGLMVADGVPRAVFDRTIHL